VLGFTPTLGQSGVATSQHMTFEQKWFTMYKHISPKKVFVGDDTILKAIGKGNIKATMHVGQIVTHNHHPSSSCFKNEE
jgi:hypothetical protein